MQTRIAADRRLCVMQALVRREPLPPNVQTPTASYASVMDGHEGDGEMDVSTPRYYARQKSEQLYNGNRTDKLTTWTGNGGHSAAGFSSAPVHVSLRYVKLRPDMPVEMDSFIRG